MPSLSSLWNLWVACSLHNRRLSIGWVQSATTCAVKKEKERSIFSPRVLALCAHLMLKRLLCRLSCLRRRRLSSVQWGKKDNCSCSTHATLQGRTIEELVMKLEASHSTARFHHHWLYQPFLCVGLCTFMPSCFFFFFNGVRSSICQYPHAFLRFQLGKSSHPSHPLTSTSYTIELLFEATSHLEMAVEQKKSERRPWK